MTPAQKAFEKLQDGEWVDDEGIEEIRKALRGVAKTQGLLKALRFYKKHAAKHSLDGICNCPTRKKAAEALAAFNSDETGVGL